jgi:RHS repeat-associated protein
MPSVWSASSLGYSAMLHDHWMSQSDPTIPSFRDFEVKNGIQAPHVASSSGMENFRHKSMAVNELQRSYTSKKTGGVTVYGYRHYTPKTGQFLGRDPIEESGGMNLYGFVGNDGVNKWDLLGMSDQSNDHGSKCPKCVIGGSEPTLEQVKRCFVAKLFTTKEYVYGTWNPLDGFGVHKTQYLEIKSGGKILYTKDKSIRSYMYYGWKDEGDCPCIAYLAEKHQTLLWAEHKMTRKNGTTYLQNTNRSNPNVGFKIITDIDYARILSGAFAFGYLPLNWVEIDNGNWELLTFEPTVKYKNETVIYHDKFIFDENGSFPKK